MKQMSISTSIAICCLTLALALDCAYGIITVQIGGATRLTSPSRSRYHCYWDCDLVGCQLTRDDDECAYDCEKVCRPRYDYLGRSGSEAAPAVSGRVSESSSSSEAGSAAISSADTELKPKSGASSESVAQPAIGSSENEINSGKL